MEYQPMPMSEDDGYDTYLCHHGIKNMVWGVRNGPPYPLVDAGKKMSNFLRKQKVKYAAAARAKRTVKEQVAQEKLNKRKMKMLAEGDIRKISKHADMFTNEELNAALERNQLLLEAKHAPNRRTAPDPHAMEGLVNFTSQLGRAASNVLPVLDAASKISSIVKADKDLKAADARAGSDEFNRRFEQLKGIDPQGAMDMYNKRYNTKYKANANADKNVLDMLLRVDPNAAAQYLSETTGREITYDPDVLRAYMDAISKSSKGSSGSGGSSGSSGSSGSGGM